MGFQVLVHLCCAILIFTIRGAVVAKVSGAGEECRMARCSHHGPEIRFPFWIKEKQPKQCGYPGFQIFCHKGKTLLLFQHLGNTSLKENLLLLSKNFSVHKIDYKSQRLLVDTSQSTNNFKLVSAATSFGKLHPYVQPQYSVLGHPYVQPQDYVFISQTITFFSCSSGTETYFNGPSASDYFPGILSIERETFPVDITSDYTEAGESSVTFCTKLFNSSLPSYILFSDKFPFDVMWSIPHCGECEVSGRHCKMKNITRSNGDAAYPTPVCSPKDHRRIHIRPVAIITPVVTFIALSMVALVYYIFRLYRQRKYDELKIEMFLTDYRAMKPTRYSYADIKKITCNFSDKLGQGGYGSVYKGQITKDIIVAVKILNSDPKANGDDFINEVGTIGRIHHVNVVRLLGYCADGCNRALVYEFQPNNSLEKFTYSEKVQQNDFLGWRKMQEIALGIAKGIDYLHQGCAQQILHFDIKPHNILLDENFNPKISDFGLAKLCSKDKSIVSMTMARGTIGYIAPEVFSRNFGKVSCKSDIYSFGMLLLEMVGARNNNTSQNNSETYFPEWIFHHLEEGGEVTIQIEEDDINVTRKLTIIGLWCIGWHPVDRPSMKHVIHMLESEECPRMPPNPFKSSNIPLFTNNLEVISELE